MEGNFYNLKRVRDNEDKRCSTAIAEGNMAKAEQHYLNSKLMTTAMYERFDEIADEVAEQMANVNVA